MSQTSQQRVVECIVDDLMAELIEEMAHSQRMHSLVARLRMHLEAANTGLMLLHKTATGDYVFEGEEYGG